MSTVFDIENATNFLYNNSKRLSGGADAEEIKDILNESDEERNVAKRKSTIIAQKAEKKESIFEKPAVTKKDKIIKYTRITILVIILFISIVLLTRVPEERLKFRQVAIARNVEKKILIKPKKGYTLKQIGIQIRGPFMPHANPVENETFPILSIYATSGEEIMISQKYNILMDDIDKFDGNDGDLKMYIFNLKSHIDDVYLNLKSKNVEKDFGVAINVDTTPVDTKQGIIYGAIVLVFLYFMIVTEIVDRTFASLIAAALSLGMLALFDTRPTAEEIIKWIDVETLTLLVGMMILVAILAESGIFDYFAVFAFKIAKGRPWPLINCLCIFTAALSTFLDSVTMMLLATPVTIRLCEVLSLDPVPILICMVLFANIGAAVTPVGDPPNVIISLNQTIKQNGLTFGVFMLHMLPGVILGLIQCYIHVRILFRKPESLQFKETDELQDLKQEIAVWERTAANITPYSQDEDIAREAINDKIDELKAQLAEEEAKGIAKKKKPPFEETLAQLTALYPLRDKVLLIKAGVVFIFLLILFIGHSLPALSHVTMGLTALLGAMLLIILADKRDLELILVRVEWSTLLFFAALFVVMESLSVLGLIDVIGKAVINIILSVQPKYRLLLAIVIVLWVSAIASAFLDNIPVTTMMVKIVVTLSQDESLQLPLLPLVWALAYGACFGGNGTLIGASANVVAAGVSEQHGYKITFVKFFLLCFPIMIGSIIVANIYLLIAHVAFTWH